MIKNSPNYSPHAAGITPNSPNYSPVMHAGNPPGGLTNIPGHMSGNNSPVYSPSINPGGYSVNSPNYSPNVN
jgi:hypothetical protein